MPRGWSKVAAELAPSRVAAALALIAASLALAAQAAPGAVAPPPGEASGKKSYSFDKDRVGVAPAGFDFVRAGEGKVGRWVVEVSKDKGRGQILVQREHEPQKKRFLLALADAPPLADATLRLKCKPVAGRVDQGCGIAFRYQGEGDYYLARLDAAEQNVRLYAVKAGVRIRLTEFPTKIAPFAWHELVVYAKGDRLVVFLDGLAVTDVHDRQLPQAGRVGIWTKSDALVELDDFVVGPFEEIGASGKRTKRGRR
jgi:hypothetical protein